MFTINFHKNIVFFCHDILQHFMKCCTPMSDISRLMLLFPLWSHCSVRAHFRTAIVRASWQHCCPCQFFCSLLSDHSAQLLRIAVADVNHVMILLLFHFDILGSLECKGYIILLCNSTTWPCTWWMLLCLFSTSAHLAAKFPSSSFFTKFHLQLLQRQCWSLLLWFCGQAARRCASAALRRVMPFVSSWSYQPLSVPSSLIAFHSFSF